mmetsp:Transcript_14125/g.29807  ORF Transcript_14125/g.29807 Transcript_14125/m.29807 type:complete len:243 (-) Transcript_14125:178-906(-)
MGHAQGLYSSPLLHAPEQPSVCRCDPPQRCCPAAALPDQDAEHGGLRRHHPWQVAALQPVARALHPRRRSRYGAGLATSEHKRQLWQRAHWRLRRHRRQPLLWLCERLPREDPQGRQDLHLGAQRAALHLLHPAPALRHLAARLRKGAPPRLDARLLRLHLARRLHVRVWRAARRHRHPICRQQPQEPGDGARDHPLVHRLGAALRLQAQRDFRRRRLPCDLLHLPLRVAAEAGACIPACVS